MCYTGGKHFTPRGITSHYPKGNFIYFSNRTRKIFTNASKSQWTRKAPPFSSNGSYQSLLGHFNYHSVAAHCNWERQYRYNRYDQYDQHNLLHQSILRQSIRSIWSIDTSDFTNPMAPLFFLFRFIWLIKVRSIVVLQSSVILLVRSPLLHLCFCFLLNPTVAPTAEVRLLSQKGMGYCCVYQGQLFLPGFFLLTEPYYCVPWAIKYNKEDLKIMSSVTQDDDHQSSDVLLSI